MSDHDRGHDGEREREARIVDLAASPGDVSEYELAVVVTATLVGDRGIIEVERRYEALPRQNDVVDRDAVDTDDDLLDDPAAVHVHTKFFDADAAGDRPDAGDDSDDEPDAGDGAGAFLRDAHTRWEPTDPSVLTDGASFEAACRAHFEETAGVAYERGVAAR